MSNVYCRFWEIYEGQVQRFYFEILLIFALNVNTDELLQSIFSSNYIQPLLVFERKFGKVFKLD